MQKISTAFVLGAGLGTRLRPYTESTPKPMLEIKGKPLIAHIFDSLIDAGISRIIINTHHCPQKYAEYFSSNKYKSAELIFVNEPILLDTGGGLKNISKYLNSKESLLIYNGDIFFEGDISKLIEAHQKNLPLATLMLRQEGTSKNVSVVGNKLVDMRFTLGCDYEKAMQFCGIFIASPSFVKEFKNYKKDIFSTVDLMLEAIKNTPNSIEVHVDNSSWTDIGTVEEYLKIK